MIHTRHDLHPKQHIRTYTHSHTHTAWSKVRKVYDRTDIVEFNQREEALSLAVDLGFAADTSTSVGPDMVSNPTSQSPVSEENGWHCFSCAKSDIVQSFSQLACKYCGASPPQL